VCTSTVRRQSSSTAPALYWALTLRGAPGQIGGLLLWESLILAVPVEVNDLGFSRPTEIWSTWPGCSTLQGAPVLHPVPVEHNGGMVTRRPPSRRLQTNMHITSEHMGWHMAVRSVSSARLRRCAARGGPRFARICTSLPGCSSTAMIESSGASFSANYWESSAKRNWLRATALRSISSDGPLQLVALLNWNHNVSDNQWYGNFNRRGCEALHFRAPRSAHNRVTARLTTHSRPTVAADLGSRSCRRNYSNVRQLSATPRRTTTTIVTPYINPSVTANPGDSNFKASNPTSSFVGNTAASTLFVVWNQGDRGCRTGRNQCVPG